jgi:hypothetical protein
VEYRQVAGRAPALARVRADVAPGLIYEYFPERTPEPAYRMNWPVRWRVEHPETRADDPKPAKTGTVPTFTLSPRDTNELFAFRYTGYLRVPRAGVYTITARADDGAAFWVGDQTVFWGVGQSPRTTESWGQIALQAGLHPITVGYFQAYGPMALALYIEGPGMPRQRIPASMLFHDRAAAP